MFQKAFLRPTQARGFRWGMMALCAMGAIVLVAVGSSPLLAEPGTVTVRVDPASRAAPVNGTFTVNIVADVGTEMDPNGVGAYEFDLVYDPNYLEVISVSDAGELDDTGRTVNELGPVNIAAGRTAFGACSYYAGTPQPAGPSGTVVLARVTLWAKRAGATTLNLENTLLTDTQANAWAGAQLNVQPGTIPMPMVVSADYDNDGATEMSVFRPSSGVWYIKTSSSNFNSYISKQWGNSTDVLVPADYDNDGATDIAVFRPSSGMWYIKTSSSNFNSYISKQWGNSTDVLVPADYDNDGATDIAVFRPSSGMWYIRTSSSNFNSYISKQWGFSTDVLVPGDYDGDNRTDIAVWRPSTGYWYIRTSSSNFNSYISKQWGFSTDVLVPGDYDGDNRTDIAIWRPSTGYWYIRTSSSNFNSYISKQWGFSTDVLVPGDYDGDGATDIAIFRPSNGQWYILTSSSNFTGYINKGWGYSTDVKLWK